MYKTILSYKNIFYKYAPSPQYLATLPDALGKSVDELQVFLETAEQKKDAVILHAVTTHWHRQIMPQYLIIARLAIGLVIAIMLLDFRIGNGLFIAPLFFLGVILYFVGSVMTAGAESKNIFQKVTQALADRILMLPVIFYSLIVYNEALLFLIVLAEIINAIISLFALDNRIVLSQNIFTKSKMTLQTVALLGTLALWPHSPNLIFVAMLWLSLIFMAISIIFKVVSIKLHFESKASHEIAKEPQNLQYAFGEKRIIEAH